MLRRRWQSKDDWIEDQHDKPRWIDTSAMICDPLTKAGTDKFHKRLVDTMESGWFDLEATPESQLRKMSKQKKALQKIDEEDEKEAFYWKDDDEAGD